MFRIGLTAALILLIQSFIYHVLFDYGHFQFQISLRLTLLAFPRPVSLSLCKDPVNSCPEWQSGHLYLVLPASLIHNIITFTWPCHASYGRWMSPSQGQQGNGPHPDFKMGRNHLSFSICCKPKEMQRGRGSSGVPSDEGMHTTAYNLDCMLSAVRDSKCFCIGIALLIHLGHFGTMLNNNKYTYPHTLNIY